MTASAPIYKSHKNMKLLKSWKRADFLLRSLTCMTSFDPGYRHPRKYSRGRLCQILTNIFLPETQQ